MSVIRSSYYYDHMCKNTDDNTILTIFHVVYLQYKNFRSPKGPKGGFKTVSYSK